MNKTTLIGHRGCRYDGYNQNTIRAFKRVMDEGIPAVEFDVQTTRDGVPVILHDLYLDNISTGSGPVTEMNWVDMAGLYAGDPERGADRIPRLEELFELAASRSEETRAVLHMELKSRGAGRAAAEAVKPWLYEGRLKEEDFLVSSFHWSELDEFTASAPWHFDLALLSGAFNRDIVFSHLPASSPDRDRVSALFHDDFFIAPFTSEEANRKFIDDLVLDVPLREALYDLAGRSLDGSVYNQHLIDEAKRREAVAINLWYFSAPPAFVRQAQAAGLRVNLYTVNEEADIRFWAEQGIDGLFTDDYAGAAAVLSAL